MAGGRRDDKGIEAAVPRSAVHTGSWGPCGPPAEGGGVPSSWLMTMEYGGVRCLLYDLLVHRGPLCGGSGEPWRVVRPAVLWVRAEWLSHCSGLQFAAPLASTLLPAIISQTVELTDSEKSWRVLCTSDEGIATQDKGVPGHQVLHINNAQSCEAFCPQFC